MPTLVTSDPKEDQFGFGVGFDDANAEQVVTSESIIKDSGVVTWPDPFPDLVGTISFDPPSQSTQQKYIDAGFAHGTNGKVVSRIDQYDFEFHPDAAKYPNIARCWYILTVIKLPEDADPRCVEQRLNKSQKLRLYFKVDRVRKMFDVLCYAYEDVESCTDMYEKERYVLRAAERSKANHDTFLGEWSFKADSQDSEQYKWNATNSVLMSVNFGNTKVVDTGDITQNMTFYLPKPTVPKVDVGPGWTKAPRDNTQKMLDEVQQYFGMEDAAFRSPVDNEPHQVVYAASIEKIEDVETLEERFGADVSFQMWWQVTKLDVIDYISAADRQNWEPEWSPLEFEIQNEAGGSDGGALIQKSGSQLVVLENKVMATKTIYAKGIFYEPFELHLYPFDTQPLGVRIQSKKSCLESLTVFVPKEKTGTIPRVRDTEWSGTVFNTDTFFIPESSGSKYGHYVLEVEAVVDRHYAVHVSRVIIVMACISLATVTAFCPDPEVHCVDRIALAVTLLLTATAYSLVISSRIPTLGYLTLLDRYILGTFAFIILIIIEIAAMGWTTAEPSKQLFSYMLYVDVGLWFVANTTFFLVVWWKIVHGERTKKNQVQRARSQSSLLLTL